MKKSVLKKCSVLVLANLFICNLAIAPAIAEPQKSAFTSPKIKKDLELLKGSVEVGERPSPFLSGSVQTIPAETTINLIVPDNMYINSEMTQKGDELWFRVGQDVSNGAGLGIPGGWYMRGLVTNSQGKKRFHRDGHLEIEFDKIVSPDGQYEIDFPAKYSSKDGTVKMIAKQVAISSAYMGAGAGAGALLAWQLTGIHTTISTYGINIGAGAAIGAAIGAFGFGKSKGNIRNFSSDDMIQMKTAEPITTVAFNPNEAQAAKPIPKLAGLELKIDKYKFVNNNWQDKSSKLLEVDVDIENNSNTPFHLFDVQAISENGQKCLPVPMSTKSGVIAPRQHGKAHFLFFSSGTKQKYFLVFKSRRTGSDLTRVPIN
ncbi:MAG: hypothetical protein SFY67_13870 [Candidatus Melainabacteria bacterium]|nr:hypothetical protein [Candidatus Melainabacteria bacterium]